MKLKEGPVCAKEKSLQLEGHLKHVKRDTWGFILYTLSR